MKSQRLIGPMLLRGLVVGVLVVGVVMRFSLLESVPLGYFVDETSILYNAWSIVETGRDEHGVSWPVFFKAFGEYKKPIYIYSLAVGFTLWSGLMEIPRLISALWGVLGVAVFGWVCYLFSKQKLIALLGMALLSITPVHVVLSRVIFEIISYPVLYLSSIGCLYLWNQQKKERYLYGFVLLQALTLYSYTAALVVAPLLVLGTLIVFVKSMNLRLLILALVTFCLGLLPLVVWEQWYPGSTLSRYYSATATTSDWSPGAMLSRALEHLTPSFLFVQGDENLRHSLSNHGVLPWMALPVLLIGLFVLVIQKHNFFARWLLIASLISLLPVVVSPQAPHVLRSIAWWLQLLVICGLGLAKLCSTRTLYVLLFTAGLLVEGWLIGRELFTQYPQVSAIWFEADTIKALELATTGGAPYYLDQELYPGTPISWAWIKRVPPLQLQRGETSFKQMDFKEQTLFTPGTYVVGYDRCTRLPDWFTNRATKLNTNQSYTCVYELEK